MKVNLPTDLFFKPLYPSEREQGDPFVLYVPPEAKTRYNYYVYTTAEEPTNGKAFPVYGSRDLSEWEQLPEVLIADPTRAYWAPAVYYLPELDYPFVMLYSRAIGQFEQGHVHHVLRRAHAKTPEGPFLDSGEELTAHLDFCIDPDVYRKPDGSLWLNIAIDFVHDQPFGTGLAEAPISEDLTRLLAEPRELMRASAEWQIYDRERHMPWKEIPGIDWERDRVAWYTLEGPVGGLVGPTGRRFTLYSGGCFYGHYAVSAIAETPDGGWEDLSVTREHFVVKPDPQRRLFGPGHCSYLKLTDGQELLFLHARFGDPDARRQMCLAPLYWTPEGLPTTLP